ncbi:hypothetical protein Dda_0380 [Drechslerella dactyloides]|uniref:RNA-binding protein n=1 Tax=Drechslerella dactyloides TaxID=74499 RepID=A0AAD6J7S4_DREDA|nr:hypothetical protein Dda_0380 [Drechslerella dactyloides]
MSYYRRPHYDSHETAAGRLPYDDERDAYHEDDRTYDHGPDHDPSRWRGRRDGSYSPRGRDHSYYDDHPARHDSRDRRTADARRSPPYRRLDRSRSPYHPPDDTRPHHSHSRSVSPESRYHRKTPPPSNRDYDRYNRRQYYDRDAPDFHELERAPFYGLPSRDVMLEGIGGDLTDHDVATLLPFAIQSELEGYNVEGLNTVTVIRERKTGISRGFAFARFRELSDSKRFLERFFPSISINNMRVSLAYAKERMEAPVSDDWNCSVCLLSNFPRRTACYRCGTSRVDSEATGPLLASAPNYFSNDGSKDAGEIPSQFLLIRELEPNVTEELLLKGAQKLSTDAHAIKRILLIRDRKTNESWRFGFVEFSNVEEAKKAYDKYEAMDGGFTIKSRSVTVSYIHPGVFVPMIQPRPGSDRWTFEPLGGLAGGIKLAYWDEEGYCKVHLAEGAKLESPRDTPEPQKEEPKAKKKNSEKMALDTGLIEKTKKRKADNISGKDGTNPTKKLPTHLQFWQERHTELHGADSVDSASEASKASKASKEPEPDVTQPKSYADPVRLCCYLCSRQFKTEPEVNKHERLSKLHEKNLQDEKLVQAAEAKLKKNGIKREGGGGEDETKGYRDRAKERRIIHSQPANPGAAKGQQKAKEAAAAARASPEKETKAPINRGASLLSKMGWTEGRGLGAQETGITAPIVAGMYVEGVGLGASGGKIGDVIDGAPESGNYSGFVERTREKARGRYEELEAKGR